MERLVRIPQFWIGVVFSFLGTILFSSKAIFIKLAYQFDVDTTSLVMLRMLFATPFYLITALLLWRRHGEDIAVIRANWYWVVLMGLLGYYGASWMDIKGLSYIDASLERIIIFVYPVLVVILSRLWLKIPFSKVQILSIVLCYTGIVIALRGNHVQQPTDHVIRGALFVMISALLYATYLVGSQKLLRKINARLYTSITMLLSCTAIFIHHSIENGNNILSFDPWLYVICLSMAILSTVLPSFFIIEGIKILGANNTSIIGSVGPLSTIIMAMIVLDEKINALQWLGTLVVISGIVVLLFYRKKSEPSHNIRA